MAKYTKNFSIEWSEECEADSFEEAEEILNEMADKQHPNEPFDKCEDIEKVE